MNIGKRIREVRITKGQSQEQFSDDIGISTRHLKSLEGGVCENTTIDTIVTIVSKSNISNFTFIVEKPGLEVSFCIMCNKKIIEKGELSDNVKESKEKLQ